MSPNTVQENFVTTLIYINHHFHTVPRIWSAADTSQDEIDSVFEQINENLPPLYRNLKDKIKDPSPKNRRENVVLLADSTKIRCAKPSNRTKQSSLYYNPKGSQNVTELHVTSLGN